MFDRKTKIFHANDKTQIKVRKIRGFKLQILTNQVRDRYIDRGEPLDPPHYFVELATGKQQRHYHNEKTIYLDPEKKIYKDELDQDTIREWEDHLDAVSRFNDEVGLSNISLVFQDGTDFELPEDETWIDNQKDLGFDVPENLKARKAHYLMTEILEDDEIQELSKIIVQQSQNSFEKIVKEAESTSESFRDQMEKPERTQVK